ncbi:hypothetical protein JXB41_08860 [Candidatus Woesearchaeota archaeon]|nr:hypothetical protein [Candidatus Woesearchaeota archaeon]
MKRKSEIRKEKRRKILIAVISAIFLISSVATVVLYRGDDTQDTIILNLSDKDYKFTRNENFYTVEINNQDVKVYNLPYELNYINISPEIIDKIKNSYLIYFTFDPEQEDLTYIDFLRFDLKESLSPLNKFIYEGTTKESSIYNLPIVTCENASAFSPVLKFSNSNTTKVHEKDSCIFIESRALGFVKIRDKIIYNLYGVV